MYRWRHRWSPAAEVLQVTEVLIPLLRKVCKSPGLHTAIGVFHTLVPGDHNDLGTNGLPAHLNRQCQPAFLVIL